MDFRSEGEGGDLGLDTYLDGGCVPKSLESGPGLVWKGGLISKPKSASCPPLLAGAGSAFSSGKEGSGRQGPWLGGWGAGGRPRKVGWAGCISRERCWAESLLSGGRSHQLSLPCDGSTSSQAEPHGRWGASGGEGEGRMSVQWGESPPRPMRHASSPRGRAPHPRVASDCPPASGGLSGRQWGGGGWEEGRVSPERVWPMVRRVSLPASGSCRGRADPAAARRAGRVG